jgi:16S rRNA pseudouridine516 synthase
MEHPMNIIRPLQRIDKLLANLGYCSRREAAAYIEKHSLTIDGKRVGDGACKVNPHNVLIDMVALDYPDGLLLLLNKPAGYVCSHDASEGPLVYDLLPIQWMRRNPVPATVGRLDKDTTGVIVITDITTINHAWSSSRKSIEKVYRVVVDKLLSPDVPALFADGMLLAGEEKPCLPAAVRIYGDYCAEVTLREGRYHQIKRMFQKCGYTVTKLHRSRFGPYDDEGVAEGAYIHVPLPAR